MARVFVGDKAKVNPDVLEAVKDLPNDFWVVLEFSVSRRNIDVLIVRPVAEGPATLIVTEVKRAARPLRGTFNGPWEQIDDLGTTPFERADYAFDSKQRDTNPYWQAVETANTLGEWLKTNEPVFAAGETGVWTDVKPWPDVLIISPPGVRHQLPLRPETGFGRWFFNIDDWIRHLETWRQTRGPVLTERDIAAVVNFLQLEQVAGGSARAITAEPHTPEPLVRTGADRVSALETRVVQLDARVKELEAVIESLRGALTAAAATAEAPARWR
jgi:hypothetical protein